MALHNPTLVLILALIAATAGLALVLNWAANRHVPGLLKIAVGFIVSAIGVLLLSQQASLGPFVGLFIATATLLGGRLVIVHGVAQFWNQERSPVVVFLAAWYLGAMIGFYYFTQINDSVPGRAALLLTLNIMINLAIAYVIFRGIRLESDLRPVMSASSHFGAYLAIALLIAISTYQFLLLLFRGGMPLMEPDTATSIFLINAILSMTIFPFAVIIMTMEELGVESRENAIFDPITTILNHRTFLEVGQRVLGVALRYEKPVTLLTIEVKNIDQVVAEHGHRVANMTLRHFALLAISHRRNEDVLARSSFKDFRMLLPGVGKSGAATVMDKMRGEVAKHAFSYQGKNIDIEFWVAATTRDAKEVDLQRMMQDGEVALTSIKHKAGSLA